MSRPCTCSACTYLRALRERQRLAGNHPIYVVNGNEGPILSQLITPDDTAYYAALLARERRP